MIGNLRNPLLQLVNRPQHNCRKTNQEDHGQQSTQYGYDCQRPHCVGSARCRIGTFHTNRGHIKLHDTIKIVSDEFNLSICYAVRQCRNLITQGSSDLPLINFGDIFPLQFETADQCPPGSGILRHTIQRPQHILGIVQGIIIVHENLLRRHRQLPHITDGLNPQQQNQGKQESDTQCQSITQFHKLR